MEGVTSLTPRFAAFCQTGRETGCPAHAPRGVAVFGVPREEGPAEGRAETQPAYLPTEGRRPVGPARRKGFSSSVWANLEEIGTPKNHAQPQST